jgi:hypothetical protein
MRDGTTTEHESFGFIRAERVSGSVALFDCAIRAGHFVRVTVGRAAQNVDAARSQIFGRDELITVAMSEAQYATFITSMNVGSGAPCTLQRVAGKQIPEPPAEVNTRETFDGEVRDRADKIKGNLAAAVESLARQLAAKGGPTKGGLQETRELVEAALRELTDGLPYMMEAFAEGLEKLTERAKLEVNAHAAFVGQGQVRLAGLQEEPGLVEGSGAGLRRADQDRVDLIVEEALRRSRTCPYSNPTTKELLVVAMSALDVYLGREEMAHALADLARRLQGEPGHGS